MAWVGLMCWRVVEAVPPHAFYANGQSLVEKFTGSVLGAVRHRSGRPGMQSRCPGPPRQWHEESSRPERPEASATMGAGLGTEHSRRRLHSGHQKHGGTSSGGAMSPLAASAACAAAVSSNAVRQAGKLLPRSLSHGPLRGLRPLQDAPWEAASCARPAGRGVRWAGKCVVVLLFFTRPAEGGGDPPQSPAQPKMRAAASVTYSMASHKCSCQSGCPAAGAGTNG